MSNEQIEKAIKDFFKANGFFNDYKTEGILVLSIDLIRQKIEGEILKKSKLKTIKIGKSS